MPSLSPLDRNKVLAAATILMDQKAQFDVPLSEVAAYAGVSVRTLQVIFREQLNISPREWLMKLRLRRARDALLAADETTSVTSVAHEHGLHHLGRFSNRYRMAFGELPSETLQIAIETRAQKRLTQRDVGRKKLHDNRGETDQTGPISPDEKAKVSVEINYLIATSPSVDVACETMHQVLNNKLGYRRGAIILKRPSDSKPFVFSHCRGGLVDGTFDVEMERVSGVLASGNGFVNSVLKSGYTRISNDVSEESSYTAMSAAIKSEACAPLLVDGLCIGAINFESELIRAFDIHDEALISAVATALAGRFS